MDLLRDKRGEAENPVCPHCRIGTKWFRSELLREAPIPIIAHFFACPACSRVQREDGASAGMPCASKAGIPFRLVAGGKT